MTFPAGVTQKSLQGQIVVSSTFPAVYEFFFPQSGVFQKGLNGYNTVGSVDVQNEGGRSLAILTEGSPASLAGVLDVPNSASQLVFDFRWTNALNTLESASFAVELTSVSGLTTRLFEVTAADESFHGDSLLRVEALIPDQFMNQSVAVRFLLDGAADDGVTSQAALGGFAVFVAVPEPAAGILACLGAVLVLVVSRVRVVRQLGGGR